MSKKTKKTKATSNSATAATATATALPIQGNDKREIPGANALTFAEARANWDKKSPDDILDPKAVLTSFDSLTTFQYAVMSCCNLATLLAVFSNITSEELDLDKAAARAKRERTEDSDLRYTKEMLYVRGSLLHVKHVAQPQTELSERVQTQYAERLKSAYGSVKRVGKDGVVKNGFAVKRVAVPARQARAKTPRVLGVREGSAQCKGAQELVKRGSMTKKELAAFWGSNVSNVLKRMERSGLVTVETDKDGVTTVVVAKQ